MTAPRPADGPAPEDRVAVIGIAGRFPGAPDVAALWQLSARGQSGLSQVGEPDQIGNVRGVLPDVERFDAGFFGIPDHEAAMIDPQQRVLLEVVQHAADDAGQDLSRAGGPVSVYAATAAHPLANPGTTPATRYQWDLATGVDFVATRISYRLGLHGESMTVQTACSSSLVAVHLAVQSLLSGQSELAIAAGVSIPPDQSVGYLVEDGMIASPSGRCRPFDIAADGAVPGAGAAAVLLKPLQAAIRDGDRIHAVVLGSAVNNDGTSKVGFMAPSPTGQSEVIATAHAVANVRAGTISYLETHGTATQLGDEVEIEGLRRAFELDDERQLTCWLGSLKANCGHLDRAAGVAGLIRAVLALEAGVIPPMAGCSQPNPKLDLAGANFGLPLEPIPWPVTGTPRRAGVSAFGVGGTNAHVVLEQAPAEQSSLNQASSDPVSLEPQPVPEKASAAQLWLLSAHRPESLRQWAGSLADQLAADPQPPAAVAGALVTGRRTDRYRSWLVVEQAGDADRLLRQLPEVNHVDRRPSVVFAFPGQGEAVVDGLPELYRTEPVFRAAIDRCAERVRAVAGFDLHDDLYGPLATAERAELFTDMSRFQPALFAVEWALAELWRSWGVAPDALIGHSIGEVTAAACASVLAVEDALALVVERSRLMEQTPLGATISVALAADQLTELPDGVEVASLNGRELTVLTGPAASIAQCAAELAARQVFVRHLNIRHSPHGSVMASAGDRLGAFLRDVRMQAPTVPILSNVTGGWIHEEMAEPGYWATQLRSTVRFTRQLDRIGELTAPVVLVLGPGAGFGRMLAHELADRAAAVISARRTESDGRAEGRADWLGAAGRAWSYGAPVDAGRISPPASHPPASHPVPLPPTVFDHGRRWPLPSTVQSQPSVAEPPVRLDDPGGWLYQPVWRPPAAGRQRRDLLWLAASDQPTGWATALTAAAGRAGRPAPAILTELPPGWQPAGPTDLLWQPPPGELLIHAAELAERLRGLDVRVWLLREQRAELVADWATALAACRVIPQEFPGGQWNLITVAEPPTADGAAGVLSLLAQGGQGLICSLADAEPRVQRHHRLWPDWRARPLRDGGCYLVTGGAGRVGLALARHLVRLDGAQVVLTGRRPTAEMASELAELSLSANGGSARYHQLDVADTEQVASLIARLRAEHGRIDGVIHAAGMTDRRAFTLAADTTAEQLRRCGEAKIAGTLALAAALRPDEADFVLLCSSLSVVLGGIRFGGYIAANAWQDEFARRQHAAGDRRWLSVEWDGWTPAPDTVRPTSAADPLHFALDDADGAAVLQRVLASPSPIIAVSTAELADRQAAVRSQLFADGAEPGPVEPAPVADAASLVAAVLRDVLGDMPADPERNLHADGVESLVILQIVSRLRSATGLSIPLADAIRELSVNGLTRLVEGAAGSRPSEEFRVAKASGRLRYPTSTVQRRWLELLDERYGGIDLMVDVRGEVAPEQLRDAVQTVLRRHSGLRTVFDPIPAGGWTQRVVAAEPVPLVDLRQLPAAEQQNRLLRYATEASRRWFEVSRSAPFEVTVFALGADRHALFIHAHHVLFDGWSSSIVLRDISRAVTGELAAEPLQYTDYALAQDAHLSGPALRRERAYWTEVFAGAPAPTRLPVTGGGPGSADHGEMLSFDLPARLLAELRARAAERAMTPFTLMMTAYSILVHRYSEDRDVVIGTTAAGRPSPDTEEIVGVFVNPLPIRFRVDPAESVGKYAEQVHRVLVGFHEHGTYPMEDLVAAVPPFTGRGLNDTFYCYLLYQNYWRPDGFGLDFAAMPMLGIHHRLMRDWEIVLSEGPDGLAGELWYRQRWFSAEWAAAALADFQRLLAELADPASWQRSVSDL